jgi:DNA-binding beta-propeller fold protein YncE
MVDVAARRWGHIAGLRDGMTEGSTLRSPVRAPFVRRTARRWVIIGAALVIVAGCSSAGQVDASAQVVNLPGAADEIGFDDVAYSAESHRILVPARESGVYFVDPSSGEAAHLDYAGSADSVDTDGELLFVLDRASQQIHVVDPNDGQTLSSASTSFRPDYVRFVEATGELWVSEPAAERIEIFVVEDGGAGPHRVGSVDVPQGPEGLTLTTAGDTAYAHAGSDVVAISTEEREVTSRWPTGCEETHGFPRVDESDDLLLASCASDGKVTLLDANDGRLLGEYQVGGGESLPAYSSDSNHFYVRSDPGTKIAILQASRSGLTLVGEVKVPEAGHCMGADDVGRYWTCDEDSGRLLLFEDS